MMRLIYLILNIIVIIVVFIKINDINCNSAKKSTFRNVEVVRTIIDTQYISVKKTIIKKGDTIFLDKVIYKDVPKIDSTEKDFIIKEYYSQSIFKDSAFFDSSSVYITDTIQGNKILGRKIDFNIKYPVITKDVMYVKKQRGSLYIGGGVITDKVDKIISGGFMYKTPKNTIYGVSVGLNNAGNTIYGINLYKKL